MDDRLVIDVARLDPEGERLVGEVDCVGLDEAFVRSFGGIRYDLTVQVVGSELLVRGSIEQDFDLVCSRCGKDFDDTVKVPDLVTSFEIGEKTSEVDLTNELRESIILALSTYPVCSESCPGVAQASAEIADDRWNALDHFLKQEGEKRNGKS